MKLTPIKVKGKGGPKKPWRLPAPPRDTRKRQRDEEEGSDNNSDAPAQRRFKSRQPAAPIEELPTEILERIIFMSPNLNFLRSSLRIGYRFSSTSFLTELLEAAFAPTWDMWFGHNRLLIPKDHKYLFNPERIPGDPDFQSAVLACKWANMSLILEAQQKWFRRHGGPGRLVEHLEPLHRRPPAQPYPPGSPLEPVKDVADVAARFEEDWETFKQESITFVTRGGDTRHLTPIMARIKYHHLCKPIYVEVHPSTTIPHRLLAGPFDWEAARTLYWLYRGGACLSDEESWSWEWTKRGYDSLMALTDEALTFTVLRLLTNVRAFQHWPGFLLDQEEERARSEEIQGDSVRLLWWHACSIFYDIKDERQAEEYARG